MEDSEIVFNQQLSIVNQVRAKQHMLWMRQHYKVPVYNYNSKWMRNYSEYYKGRHFSYADVWNPRTGKVAKMFYTMFRMPWWEKLICVFWALNFNNRIGRWMHYQESWIRDEQD